MTPWGVRPFVVTGLLALVLLVAGFGSWSVTAQIAGAIIAPGRVAADRNRQIVQHSFGGVVSDIFVADGDAVAKDDLLIRLDAQDLRSDLIIIESQLFDMLARRAVLEAARDDAAKLAFDPVLLTSPQPAAQQVMASHQRLFAASRDTERQSIQRLMQQRTQIASQADGVAAQQAALTMQRDLIARELADQQDLLDRGLAQASRVMALQREEANILGRLGELAAQTAQSAARMTEIDIQILSLGATRREDAVAQLRDLQARQFELTERHVILRRQLDRLDIRAPVAGVIYDMQVFAPKSVIRPAEPVLFIIPQDRPPVITAELRAGDIDQVFVGQPVTVRFSEFDQQRIPELSGQITRLSADAFRNDTTGAFFYRAEVRISTGETARLPPGFALIPGMPADIFARTGTRRPIDYLFSPMTDYFTRSFRDG